MIEDTLEERKRFFRRFSAMNVHTSSEMLAKLLSAKNTCLDTSDGWVRHSFLDV